MFEEAVRKKYRFQSKMGWINVEDLWDLSVELLDEVYKKLKSELKQANEDSLLVTTSENKDIENKVNIVKHIFTMKVAEKEERENAKKRREKKHYLLSLLQEKQNDEYKSKSVEELQKLIDDL